MWWLFYLWIVFNVIFRINSPSQFTVCDPLPVTLLQSHKSLDRICRVFPSMSFKAKLFSLSLTQTLSGVTQDMWRHQQPSYTSGSVIELINTGKNITFSRHSFPCCWFIVFVVDILLGSSILSEAIGFKSKHTKYVCQKELFKHWILVFEILSHLQLSLHTNWEAYIRAFLKYLPVPLI